MLYEEDIESLKRFIFKLLKEWAKKHLVVKIKQSAEVPCISDSDSDKEVNSSDDCQHRRCLSAPSSVLLSLPHYEEEEK